MVPLPNARKKSFLLPRDHEKIPPEARPMKEVIGPSENPPLPSHYSKEGNWGRVSQARIQSEEAAFSLKRLHGLINTYCGTCEIMHAHFVLRMLDGGTERNMRLCKGD